MNGYVSSKKHVSMNDECMLITQSATVNDLGIQADTADEATPVYCAHLSVEGKEYYEAAQQGLRPEMILAIHTEEYDGQEYVDFDGKRYAIYRRYDRADGLTELYCTLRLGDKS